MISKNNLILTPEDVEKNSPEELLSLLEKNFGIITNNQEIGKLCFAKIASLVIGKQPELDNQVVEKLIEYGAEAIAFIDENLLSKHIEWITSAIEKRLTVYSVLPLNLKENPKVVSKFLSTNKDNLNISSRFKEIPKTFFEVVDNERRSIVIDILKTKKIVLSDFPAWKDDFEVVKNASQVWGESIRFASDRLKDNDEMAWIIANAGNQAYGLKFVSFRLKNNKELIKTALSNCGRLLADLTNFEYVTDFDCAMIAVKNDPAVIGNVESEIEDYEKIAIEALRRDSSTYSWIHRPHLISENVLEVLAEEDLASFYDIGVSLPKNRFEEKLILLQKRFASKNQDRLLLSFKNATRNSQITDIKMTSKVTKCFDLIVKPSSRDTLKLMREVLKNKNFNEDIDNYLVKEIERKEILEISASENSSKNGKTRKTSKLYGHH